MNVGSVASIAWDLSCGIRRIIVGCVKILATETDDARLSYNVDCPTSTLSVTVFYELRE